LYYDSKILVDSSRWGNCLLDLEKWLDTSLEFKIFAEDTSYNRSTDFTDTRSMQ